MTDIFITRAQQQARRAVYSRRPLSQCHWTWILRAINYHIQHPDNIHAELAYQDTIFSAFKAEYAKTRAPYGCHYPKPATEMRP